MKLFYAGQQGGPFGWGVCGENLVRELSKHCEITGPAKADVLLTPLADHDLNAPTPIRCKVNMAYTFFESPLGPNAAQNAAKYDAVFAGSTWCLDRLRERGITKTALLIQGVDETIFSPQPPRKPDGQFRIFSGGKFEYRKGQDLVIAAFKEFAKHEPSAHLVCSWFNPWPQLFHSMNDSEHIKYLCGLLMAGRFDTEEEYFEAVLLENGLSLEQFTVLPQLSQTELAAEMANTDCGLFPNRCEGGTNLVLMEYARLGRDVLANTCTGHADVRRAITLPLKSRYMENGWAETCIEDTVENLVVAKRDGASHLTVPCWPWSEPARIVMEHARQLTTA